MTTRRRVSRFGCIFALCVLMPALAHAGAIQLAWNPSTDGSVTGYRVLYGTSSGAYPFSVNVGNSTTHVVSGLSNGTTYYFVVRAYNASGALSSPSNEVAGMPVSIQFTDPAITTGLTIARTLHITELRTRVASLRAARNLSVFNWTDPTLTGTSSVIKAAHIAELRSALQAVYISRGLPAPNYTDPTITPGTTRVRAAHISELRAAVQALE